MSSCTLRASFAAECASQVSVVTSNRESRCAMDASVVGANADGAARMVDARSGVKRDSSLRARQLKTHLKKLRVVTTNERTTWAVCSRGCGCDGVESGIHHSFELALGETNAELVADLSVETLGRSGFAGRYARYVVHGDALHS